MKSRLAMTAMLVSGLLMSGTGATLAVSGTTDDSAKQQYPTTPSVVATPTPTSTPGPSATTAPAPAPDGSGVLPTTTTGDAPAPAPVAAPKSDTSPSDSPSTSSPSKDDVAPATREQGADPAQPTEQLKADGEETLPFTGFAAIPILVGGIALMGGGLVMRRRTAA